MPGSVSIVITIETSSISAAQDVTSALAEVTKSAAAASKFLSGTPGLPPGFDVTDITMPP